MPVGRTPPRRASRGSGAGYGKREKKAVVPFTPEPEKKANERSVARGGGRGGRGGSGGRGGRGGRGAKRGNDDAVVNKVRADDSSSRRRAIPIDQTLSASAEGSTGSAHFFGCQRTTVRRSFSCDTPPLTDLAPLVPAAAVRASQEPHREPNERDSPAALHDRGVRHGRVERREVSGTPSISTTNDDCPFALRWSPSSTPGCADKTSARARRPGAKPATRNSPNALIPRENMTAAARNSAPRPRSPRRARRSSPLSSASASCSNNWSIKRRTRTSSASPKKKPSTRTERMTKPLFNPNRTTRASTPRTSSAPPAAEATRTTTMTFYCATGSARARTTCPA